MKIHISFVCLKNCKSVFNENKFFFIREIFRSIFNENTDPFLFKKISDLYLIKIQIFFQKKIQIYI